MTQPKGRAGHDYDYVSLANVNQLVAEGKTNMKVNLYAAIYEKHDPRNSNGTGEDSLCLCGCSCI